ncbi:hypothetical protein PINS_up005015 [Pythium insidiosum]|nr:hypothetical protein PINS_up005015 [Pythium insidiosum]
MEMHDAFFHDVPADRELPPCDIERLDEILTMVKTTHPTLRVKVLRDLADDDGAYIVKLLDLFDVAELDADKSVLHRIFDIFYALIELCDRRVIELLLSDQNFLTVVGVLGYNPGLIREMDFRSELEGATGFKEVIPIRDSNVLARVHMNYRIHVIKDNVLSRSLPDCSVIMLDHIVNENNYHILSYISDVPDYCQSLKDLVRNIDTQLNGLGLLKEVIQLVRITRPLDKLPQPRRDAFGAPPVFGQLINNLFGDGALFEAFSVILGSIESSIRAVELALDILNVLVFYQGPERLRTYLASEGKCIAPPTSDKDRIQWKPGASLFTALIFAFERYEPTRVQMFTLLKEIFKVSLPQDDKFLNVLYPNYIHWLLQPLKYISVDDEAVLFALQDSIMELLTFCTEAHGYRIKYLFGRQPIASYVERMLRSRNKLFVIHAVKFMRACAARGEAFFSRFLIQNDLFVPVFEKLQHGQRNTCAVSSAILEMLAFIEKSNLTSLIEHIYTKFYSAHKDECPLVFESIRSRYEDAFGNARATIDDTEREKRRSVHKSCFDDDEEERYWEKDEPTDQAFVPSLSHDALAEVDVRCRAPDAEKLVDYPDDDDEPASPLKEGDLVGRLLPSPKEGATSPSGSENAASAPTDVEDENDLKLPVREKKQEDNTAFLAGGLNARKNATKKVKSPQYKAMFEQISWSIGSGSGSPKKANENSPTSRSSPSTDATSPPHVEAASLISKRKLEMEDNASSPDSILKKTKTCTAVSSS